jgi:hypothetical protein
VSTDRSGHLAGAATALRRARAAGGALTLQVGGPGGVAEVVARLRRSFAHCTALTFREAPGIGGGAGLHVVDDDHPFPDVWRAALGRRGRAAVAR